MAIRLNGKSVGENIGFGKMELAIRDAELSGDTAEVKRLTEKRERVVTAARERGRRQREANQAKRERQREGMLDAIKRIREERGCSLIEAKAIVERERGIR